jgi:arylsulfatase A-like enzyme
LFDQAFVDQPNIAEICQSWWTGTHRLERRDGANVLPLAARLSQAGFAATCLTDEPIVADHSLMSGFDEVVRVGFAAGDVQATELAADVEDTQLAHFFAAAAHFLEDAREPFVLWLHSRGMEGAWDAPYTFREQYSDEQESAPPRIIEPPCRLLTAQDDPDELWGYGQAYAGQVTLVDECLGGLLESLEAEQLADDTVLVVLGARGFPLGRNGRLGDLDQALYSELVQTPWLMRFPDGLGTAARSQALVQPCDLMPTLLELAGVVEQGFTTGWSLLPLVRDDSLSLRDRICLVGQNGERGLRTPAWHLRMPAASASGEAAPPELYAKPDDRWEVNDVAGRCPNIVAAMQIAHDALLEKLVSGQLEELPALDEELVNELR